MRFPHVLRITVTLMLAMLLGLSSLIAPVIAQDATPGDATPESTDIIASPEASPIEQVVGSPDAVETEVAVSSPEPVVGASPMASPVAEAPAGTVDLDVLFVGGHPDDEAFGLGAYGQWMEFNDAQVGVITVTRGEGGGNAVGTEEGPALGLLREAEERNAVGMAGIEHIYNLDKVDFYYTVSAELTADTWDYEDTLERVVRVIRQTKPEIIITMNPAPTPGQHGHHQMAARYAIDAFYSAADPTVFPGQIDDEGLSVWRASRIMRSGASGEETPGPECAETYQPAETTDVVYGVWNGMESEINGTNWGAVARMAQKAYASQGWAGFPDAPTDPDEIGCVFFTLIDSRAPFDPSNTSPTAILEGAVIPADGGLPLGAEFYLTTSTFNVTAGAPFDVGAHLRMENADPDAEVVITLPEGWELGEAVDAAEVDGEMQWTMQVTPAMDADVNTRFRIDATVAWNDGNAMTTEVVEVAAPVTGELEPLGEVAYFKEWVAEVGAPQLDSLIVPVFSMGVDESRVITINLVNVSSEPASGSVTLALPTGFVAEPATQEYTDLAADGEGTVEFTVSNTDVTLATSVEGGEEGNYPLTVTTTSDSGESVQSAGINLVPVTTVPKADVAPTVDGVIDADEYTGEALDLSRLWEGQPVDSPEDASGTAHVTYTDEGIFIAVEVTDDVLGTVLPHADAKRHWRTDSVEIAIDPLGTASNTSTTFKVGVFPTTEEGEPAAYRDADAHQGPVAETAPGFEYAATVSEPYAGYVLEVMIPYDVLPADIDPDNATMNIFIYDSDTDDLTGQSRLGWSVWGGVQGDPYRWGKTIFEGFETVADPRITPDEPVMPLEAAQSVNSPLSILQSANDGVGLAGNASVPEGEGLIVESVTTEDGESQIMFTSQSDGDVRVFHFVDGQVMGEFSDTVSADVTRSYGFPEAMGKQGYILVSFVDSDGRVQAIAEALP